MARILTIILLGALIGAVLMCVATIVVEQSWQDPNAWQTLPDVVGTSLVLGWMIGLAPASLAALLWHYLVSPSWSFLQQLVALAAIGFFTSMPLVWLLMAAILGSYAPDLWFYALAGFSGAIALVITARPGAPRQ